MPSEKPPQRGELEAMPRIELVSVYMNRYASLDEARRRAFEREFARRGLPLPDMSAVAPPGPAPRPIRRGKGSARKPLDRPTFLSYVFLIYTLTGLVYSWVFLASRLVRRDIVKDPRHQVIQTAISIAYLSLEGIVLLLLEGE